MEVTLESIRNAATLIRDRVEKTPCIHSHTLSAIIGAEIILKFENLQFTGSFKDRGALVKLLTLNDVQRQKGVIAMSAGNHAQAVAYHAQRLGIPAVIVMPRFTPNIKVEHTRGFGAEVVIKGDGLDEAGSFAREIAEQKGYCLIHPYDDPAIIAGQGTIALEMLADYPDLDYLIVPVGGGGLIAGNGVSAKSIRPECKIIGVEAAGYPAMSCALVGKEPKFGTFTIAEGIAVKEPGRLTLPIIKKLVDRIMLVDDRQIEEALLLLLEVEKTVAEGAGAAGLAAVLKHRDIFKGKKLGLIISGGNIDMPLLSSIIQRGLVRSGRLVRLHVDMRDIPGALADVTKLIGKAGGNIVHIDHQRTFSTLPVQIAEVEFTIQTRGPEHLQEIVTCLLKDDYQARVIPAD